jgi:hypothetical protein
MSLIADHTFQELESYRILRLSDVLKGRRSSIVDHLAIGRAAGFGNRQKVTRH